MEPTSVVTPSRFDFLNCAVHLTVTHEEVTDGLVIKMWRAAAMRGPR